MAVYNTNHPNYPKTTLKIPIGDYQVGQNAGIAGKFTSDLIWVPNELTSSATSSDNDVRPFKTLYGVVDSERFNYSYTDRTLSAVNSSILPFKDVLKIGGLNIAPFFDISTTERRAIKFLFTNNNVDYYAVLSATYYTTSSSRPIVLKIGIGYLINGNYAVLSDIPVLEISKSGAGYPDSVTDGSTAATFVNGFLSGLKYVFITPFRYYGGANNLSITTNDRRIVFGYCYENTYSWYTPNQFTEQIFNVDMNDIEDYQGYEPEPTPPTPEPSTDPYSQGGYSDTGGGPAGTGGTGATGTGGLHDDTSDNINTPVTPPDVAINGGFISAYNPTIAQLASLGSALWNATPTDFNDLFRILFGGDAFNAIIGMHLLPVQPSVNSGSHIMLGNWDSGVTAPKITSQYTQVSFGSLMLPEFWGNSIDYSPYTRVQLALPYIGIVDVDTDDVIGSVNTLTYNIDVLSGAICASLHCVKGNLSSVIYEWSGSCAVQIPITGSNYNSVLGSIMAVGGAVVGATALASGPIGAALGTGLSLGVGTGMVSGAAGNMFGTMKGKVQKSGGFSANSGALGIMTPYFIVTRPVQSIPSTQQATKGYPSNISAHLGDLHGYTEITEVHLHNIPGTKDEVLEIEELLKKGVIF